MKHLVFFTVVFLMFSVFLTGCEESASSSYGTHEDIAVQKDTANRMANNQPTPTDIDYSLERYNLIRRAYWVNGQREKANSIPCAVVKPLGYILLFTDMGQVIGNFVVDGKVSSLRNYLTPDSEYYERIYGGDYTEYNRWLADVDGAYGENPDGIFFFDVQGNYYEWTGLYLYSDVLFDVDSVLTIKK